VKRRQADRPQFSRVTQRRFYVERLDSEDYTSYVTLLCIDAVREPLWVSCGDNRVCVADEGYSWLQHFPAKAHYTVTTMFDAAGRIVQWYIDVCKQHGVDESGVPWQDDLYLDIAMLPSGEIELLDVAELDRAWWQGSISQADHDLAWREAKRIMDEIGRGEFALLKLAEPHRNRLLAAHGV